MNDPSGEFHFDFQRQPRANRPSDEETTLLNQSQNSEATQAFPTSSNPVSNTAATSASPASLGETQAMPPLWDLEDFAAPGTAPSAAQPTQAMPQTTSAAQQPTQAMPQPVQAFPTMPTPPAASSTPDQLQATAVRHYPHQIVRRVGVISLGDPAAIGQAGMRNTAAH